MPIHQLELIMKLTVGLLCFLAIVVAIVAPPVVKNAQKNKGKADPKDDENSDDVLDKLEYGRYLKEVVEILETDPEFKKKIQNATLDEIKSGNIAEHLSLVQHHVRTQLDEAKQREMGRLRDLVGQRLRNLNEKQRLALTRGDPNGKRLKEFLPQHVDHRDVESFNEKDLERLIRHATKDLDQIDRKREQEFKEYELKKEYQRRTKLEKLDTAQRRRLELLHEQAMDQKKRHRKVNHPGSVDQMEEVWEKVDHLEAEQFKPKSFFQLHDINGDGFLDEAELEAIMLKEAEKIHDETPEADSVERQEEMDRMREHVMREFDADNDRMLSWDEFEHGMNGTGAKNDQGWKSIEDTTVFSDQEFQRFSEQMAPRSTPIPPHQTPSPAASQPSSPAPAIDKAVPVAVQQPPAAVPPHP